MRSTTKIKLMLISFIFLFLFPISVKASIFSEESDFGDTVMDYLDVDARRIEMKNGDVLKFHALHNGGNATFNVAIMSESIYKKFMNQIGEMKAGETPSNPITDSDFFVEDAKVDDDVTLTYTSSNEQIIYFGITHFDSTEQDQIVYVKWDYIIERQSSQEFLAWISENDLNKILLMLSIVSTFIAIFRRGDKKK